MAEISEEAAQDLDTGLSESQAGIDTSHNAAN